MATLSGAKLSEDQIGSGTSAKDDYALRQAPPTWRYPWTSLTLSVLGTSTAGFFLAFPAGLAKAYGVTNVILGIIYGFIILTALNYVLVKAASRTGLNSNLLSRGLGLGFGGSAWATIIYWLTWVGYFGIEGGIASIAISKFTGLPDWIAHLLVGGVFIPLVIYGVKFINLFQKWTLYIYMVGVILILIRVFSTHDVGSAIAATFSTDNQVGGLGLLAVLAAVNGVIGNALFGQVDVGRLGPNEKSLLKGSRKGLLMYSAFPIGFGAFILFQLLGILLWAVSGKDNPGEYYLDFVGVFGFLLIIIAQLRINLMNTYSGSISLANFFSRFGILPGRHVWAIVMVIIGTALMFGDVVHHMHDLLTYEALFLNAWIGVIVADLVINRGLFKYGPKNGQFIEYRRALVRNWNVVGVVPMVVSTIIGLAMALLGGEIGFYLSSFATFIIAGAGTIILGRVYKGSTYNIREAAPWPREDAVIHCPIDGEIVSTGDMVPCPHHNQWISSNACMATRNCGEKCIKMEQQKLLKIQLPEKSSDLLQVNERLIGQR